MSAVVSASRRTELVALKPDWLVNALQRFPKRYHREIHSVVLWTKDPTNIYEHKALREELSKHNLVVHCTITGLGGTRIEPTVPPAEELLEKLPKLLEFLGDPKRLRWRFDPIVTLEKPDGSEWSSSVLFEPLAKEMAKLGVDNCYFSFCQIYHQKFIRRQLDKVGIHIISPWPKNQIRLVRDMKRIAAEKDLTLYACAQPLLNNVSGIIPAKCIDAELLIALHPQNKPASLQRDEIQAKYRPSCYCTQSKDIGGYSPCGHGCAYCYAEAAIPKLEKLSQKPHRGN